MENLPEADKKHKRFPTMLGNQVVEKMNVQHRTKPTETTRYILAPGTQVREEDFGLLFYTMKGPRLYFLSSGRMLDCSFFEGKFSLDEWIALQTENGSGHVEKKEGIRESLSRLKDKGVILER